MNFGPCSCLDCQHGRYHDDPNRLPFMRVMPICSECGNKRCPKATNHRHACTRSNDPGQAGSDY